MIRPVQEIKATNDEGLLMEFEAHFRSRLVKSPEGAGRSRGPGLGEGWIHGLRNVSIQAPTPNDMRGFVPLIEDKFGGRAPTQVMFNVLPPGAYLDWHIDGAPYRERWHYIITGNSVYMQGEKPSVQVVEQRPGYWYGPISYWVPHSVTNYTHNERIALLVDMEEAWI